MKPAVQRLKIRKNKTYFDDMKGTLIFLALLGRFGVWGIGTPKLLVLLVTKEHNPLRLRRNLPNILNLKFNFFNNRKKAPLYIRGAKRRSIALNIFLKMFIFVQ